MAEERILKITNISNFDLPPHKPGEPGCSGFGCVGCVVPTWNRIEFPMRKGETIVVKENVGNHLTTSFRGKIKVTEGPFDTTQLLQSPQGFFEHDPITGRFRPLNVKTDTTALGGPQDRDAEGEDISVVKGKQKDIDDKGRFIATGKV